MVISADSIAGASILNGPFTDDFLIADEADIALVGVHLDAGRIYEFDTDGGGDTLIRIFDAAGVEMKSFDDDLAFGESFEIGPSYTRFAPAVSGVYYVGVSHFFQSAYDPNSLTSGRFTDTGFGALPSGTLTVGDFSPAVFPSANAATSILFKDVNDLGDVFDDADRRIRIELGTTQLVSPYTDVELARVALVKGDVLVIDVNGSVGPDDLQSFIRVFNVSGVELRHNEGGGTGLDAELVFTTPVSSTAYFIGISGVGNETYTVLDGLGTTTGDTGTFQVILHRNPTLLGTGAGQTLTGTSRDDYIVGRAGVDTLIGNSGDDVLSGGDDDDTLSGDNGRDQVFGDQGDDIVNGGDGRDTLSGGLGDDTLGGGIGDDRLFGGEADDTLNGSDGNDFVDGGSGADAGNGGFGDDVIDGGEDDDVLNGGDGADVLFGRAGADRLIGGANDDEAEGGDGIDILNGGTGNDRLTGGAEVDTCTGGEGSDRFVFTSTGPASGIDVITDFDDDLGGGPDLEGRDLIDLSAIFAGTGAVVTITNIEEFIATSTDGDGGSFLEVDANGLVGGADFVIIAEVSSINPADLLDLANFIV